AAPDVTVNDAFRPLWRFFDRITRPEQLLTALPGAFRVLANPVETGPAVISLPQDVQSHAHDFPLEFFPPRVWKSRRPLPDPAARSPPAPCTCSHTLTTARESSSAAVGGRSAARFRIPPRSPRCRASSARPRNR